MLFLLFFLKIIFILNKAGWRTVVPRSPAMAKQSLAQGTQGLGRRVMPQ